MWSAFGIVASPNSEKKQCKARVYDITPNLVVDLVDLLSSPTSVLSGFGCEPFLPSPPLPNLLFSLHQHTLSALSGDFTKRNKYP